MQKYSSSYCSWYFVLVCAIGARYTLYSHKECVYGVRVYKTMSEVLYSSRRTFSLYFIFRVRTAIDDLIILLHYKNEKLYMLKIEIMLNDSNLLIYTIDII
jgi:hypothetical protein